MGRYGWRAGERVKGTQQQRIHSKNHRASQWACLSPLPGGDEQAQVGRLQGLKTPISYFLIVSPREPNRDWGNKSGPQHVPTTVLKLQ